MVRIIYTIVILGFLIVEANAQNVGIGTQSPDASALLDVESTNSGFLIPRLTTTQRNSIDLSGDPQGLMIYNSTDKCFQLYVDNNWRSVWCLDCAVSISTQPSTATLCLGTSHTLSVSATGSISNYQWQKDDVDITGATSSSYVLSSITSSDAGDYKVIISGSCDTVTSTEVTMTVSDIEITSHPSSSEISSSDNTTFSITAAGTGISYQWQESQNSGSSWSDLSNAGVFSNVTTSSMTITSATSGMNGYQYRCVVTGTCNDTSNAASLTVWDCGDAVTDYNGNSYNTVELGSQCWMSENLKALNYSDGTAITLITSSTDWDNQSITDKGCAYYSFNSSNAADYGLLYSWAAATNGASSTDADPSGVQGACPVGWHVPSHAEWREVEEHLGMTPTESASNGYRGTNVGSKMAGNVSLWTSGTLTTNANFGSSGLNIVPGGKISQAGNFADMSITGGYWSTLHTSGDYARTRIIWNGYNTVNNAAIHREIGYSVRCVKD